MKNIFVLDECFIRCVSQSVNEKGEFDTSFGLLLYSIIHNCHKIAITQCLFSKYSLKIDEIKLEQEVHRNDIFFHLLNSIMVNSDKLLWETETIFTFPKNSFDNDDEQIVSLSSKKNAILVTVDDKLINELNENKITELYNFNVKRPEDAILDAQ